MLGVVIQNVSRSSEECSRSMWTIPRIATARTCPSRRSWLCQQDSAEWIHQQVARSLLLYGEGDRAERRARSGRVRRSVANATDAWPAHKCHLTHLGLEHCRRIANWVQNTTVVVLGSEHISQFPMFQVCSITVEDQEHFRDILPLLTSHLLGKRSDIRFGSL